MTTARPAPGTRAASTIASFRSSQSASLTPPAGLAPAVVHHGRPRAHRASTAGCASPDKPVNAAGSTITYRHLARNRPATRPRAAGQSDRLCQVVACRVGALWPVGPLLEPGAAAVTGEPDDPQIAVLLARRVSIADLGPDHRRRAVDGKGVGGQGEDLVKAFTPPTVTELSYSPAACKCVSGPVKIGFRSGCMVPRRVGGSAGSELSTWPRCPASWNWKPARGAHR
jgi:hypothetical protein